MKLTAGIDFGTTNSAVSYMENSIVKMVNFEEGSEFIPTALFFMAETNKRLYGSQAIEAFLSQKDGRLIRSMKSILGTVLMDRYTWVNKYAIEFKDIIRYFISHLKSKLSAVTGIEEIHAVFGRPVRFHEDDDALDKKAETLLREIALASGFNSAEFQYEPIAAAFQHEQDLGEEKLAMVLDIGGGTSDFAVIKIGRELSKKTDRSDDILSCTGVKTGGNDFDKYLNFNAFMPFLGKDAVMGEKRLPLPSHVFFQLSDWSGINFMYERDNFRTIRDICRESHNKTETDRLFQLVSSQRAHELLGIAEDVKIKLSTQNTVKSVLKPVIDKPEVSVRLNEFNDYTEEFFVKIKSSMNECLKLSGKKGTEIDLVILTGGSTDMVKIREMTKETFPKAKISDQNKFSSVSMGLTHDAQRRY